MRRRSISLPWVEPLLVAALHAPLTAAWLALLQPETGTMVYLAWQLIAFPLVAAACLIAISPAQWLVERTFTIFTMPGRFIPNLVVAVASAGVASFLLLRVPAFPVGLLGAWFFGLVAALALRRTIANVQAKKPSRPHPGEA